MTTSNSRSILRRTSLEASRAKGCARSTHVSAADPNAPVVGVTSEVEANPYRFPSINRTGPTLRGPHFVATAGQ